MTLARFCKSHLHRYLSTKALMRLTKYTVGVLKNSRWCLWPRTSCYNWHLLTKACNGHIFFTCFWKPNMFVFSLSEARVFLLLISTTRNLVVKRNPGFERGTFSSQADLVWAVWCVTGWERLHVNSHWLACMGVWPLSAFAAFPAHFNCFSLIGVMCWVWGQYSSGEIGLRMSTCKSEMVLCWCFSSSQRSALPGWC